MSAADRFNASVNIDKAHCLLPAGDDDDGGAEEVAPACPAHS